MESLEDRIKKFLSLGSGSGYGDGSGYGYGSGSGYGYGSGSGYGYGYGSGSGDGYGDDYGSGYGSGDIKFFNGHKVYMVDDVQTIILQVKGNYARGFILKEDMTLKPCIVAKYNNHFAHAETLHAALEEARLKDLEDKSEEERIDEFCDTFKSLDEKHTGKEFYDWHHILTGSCTMGRDEFCAAHDVQMDALYTVGYFLDLVANSYGSAIIRQVRERYE